MLNKSLVFNPNTTTVQTNYNTDKNYIVSKDSFGELMDVMPADSELIGALEPGREHYRAGGRIPAAGRGTERIRESSAGRSRGRRRPMGGFPCQVLPLPSGFPKVRVHQAPALRSA